MTFSKDVEPKKRNRTKRCCLPPRVVVVLQKSNKFFEEIYNPILKVLASTGYSFWHLNFVLFILKINYVLLSSILDFGVEFITDIFCVATMIFFACFFFFLKLSPTFYFDKFLSSHFSHNFLI
jgi:hypothetical protein